MKVNGLEGENSVNWYHQTENQIWKITLPYPAKPIPFSERILPLSNSTRLYKHLLLNCWNGIRVLKQNFLNTSSR